MQEELAALYKKSTNATIYYTEEDGQVVGWALVRRVYYRKFNWKTEVYVRKSHRRKGIGSALVKRAFEDFGETSVSKIDAPDFFLKFFKRRNENLL